MAARIGAFEPGGLYPSVNLGARHARVPEHLLDRPQIGAAVEQMGGEAVAQRMGRPLPGRAPTPGPQPQSPAYVAGTEAPTVAAHEQRQRGARRRRLPGELRAGPLEV